MDDPPSSIGPNADALIEDELWSIKAIIARTGLSRSTVYDYIAQGLFPRQRRLGPRRVGWLAGRRDRCRRFELPWWISDFGVPPDTARRPLRGASETTPLI